MLESNNIFWIIADELLSQQFSMVEKMMLSRVVKKGQTQRKIDDKIVFHYHFDAMAWARLCCRKVNWLPLALWLDIPLYWNYTSNAILWKMTTPRGRGQERQKKKWTIDIFSWFENSKFPIGHKIRIDIIELCRSCDYNGRSHRKTQWTVESINTFVISMLRPKCNRNIFSLLLFYQEYFLFVRLKDFFNGFSFIWWNLSFCWQCQAVNSLGMQSDTNLPFVNTFFRI